MAVYWHNVPPQMYGTYLRERAGWRREKGERGDYFSFICVRACREIDIDCVFKTLLSEPPFLSRHFLGPATILPHFVSDFS